MYLIPRDTELFPRPILFSIRRTSARYWRHEYGSSHVRRWR